MCLTSTGHVYGSLSFVLKCNMKNPSSSCPESVSIMPSAFFSCKTSSHEIRYHASYGNIQTGRQMSQGPWPRQRSASTSHTISGSLNQSGQAAPGAGGQQHRPRHKQAHPEGNQRDFNTDDLISERVKKKNVGSTRKKNEKLKL